MNHEILTKTLQSYGIMGTELSWFVDYLRNRSEMVGFGNKLSDPCPITSRVPPGSMLAPLLFVLLVNDLPLATNRCSTLMYAYYTLSYYTDKDLRKEKTECILFGTGARLSSVNSFTVSVKGQ